MTTIRISPSWDREDLSLMQRRLSLLLTMTAALAVFAFGNYGLGLEGWPLHLWANAGWTVAALLVTWKCLAVAQASRGLDRRSWRCFGLGCGAWFLAMVVWSYLELVAGVMTPFPSLADPLFLVLPLLFMAGMVSYRSATGARGIIVKQVSNLGIVACAVLIIVPLVLMDSLGRTTHSPLYLMTALGHPVLYLTALFFGLICLCFRAWGQKRCVLALLVIGLGSWAVTDILYAYYLLEQAYRVGAPLDIAWLIGFAFVYWAAFEHQHLSQPGSLVADPWLMTRLRGAETLVPAAALLSILLVAYAFREHLSEEALVVLLPLTAVFTAFLGLRQWWDHRVETTLREEAQRAAAELQSSEERYRSVVRHSLDGIFLVSADGRVLAANPAACRMLGYTLDEILKTSRSDILDLADPRTAAAVVQRDATAVFHGEITYRRKDGTVVPVEVSSVRFHNAKGAQFFSIVARDISERQRVEAELRRAKEAAEEADRAKSRFFAAASHDVRQPLHAAALFASLLSERVTEAGQRQLVQSISTSVEAAAKLLGELLDLAKLEAGVLQPEVTDFGIDRLLERLEAEYAALARAGGLDLRVVPSSAVVRSDPIFLECILRNLISNALKYTDSGRILVGCRRLGASLRVEVWDTGPGIPPDQLQTIFQEFVRLPQSGRGSRDGLGLGLAIVERKALLLRHPIVVRSQPGRGSLFAVEVPLGRRGRKLPQRLALEAAVEDEVAGRVVLLVDDDPEVLRAMRERLEAWRCEVMAAASGPQALDAIRVAARCPDLAIVDDQLGEGMTGKELIDALRARFANVPTIVITGNTAAERVRTVESSGCEVLHKPVPPLKLRTALARALARRGPGRADAKA